MAYAALSASLVIDDPSMIRVAEVANEAITAGNVVRKRTDGKWEIADSNASATADLSLGGGVALGGCPSGGSFVYAPPGATLTLSGLTAVETYFLGGGADEGKVGLRADVVTGTDYATVVGFSLSTTKLFLVLKALGAVPA